ncbi:MAG: hypothetical protein Q8918_19120 [Bacteroidota bacterium]|nr:hypothetical protein [Bacteroidota bacterium]MDP4252217.1 hypothetical protein [Bacteroidota bacterium]
MAKQGTIRLQCTIGENIFYSLRGGYYMRRKPAEVRRTAASVKSGLNFGKASRICRQLRELIALPDPADKQPMFRLTGALNKFINWNSSRPASGQGRLTGLPWLTDFQFNERAMVAGIKVMQIRVETTSPGQTELSLSPFIPASALKAPPGTEQVICRITVTASDPDRVSTRLLGKTEINIPVNDWLFQAPGLSLTPAAPGEIMLVIMALEYQLNQDGGLKSDERMQYRPCGIVWSAMD